MIKKIIYIMIALLLSSTICFADDKCAEGNCEAWTQEMFNTLVVFVYNYGEIITTASGERLYNITITLPDNKDHLAHLGLLEDAFEVILTIEDFTYLSNGDRLVDHNFYYSYFLEDLGVYYYLPNYISGNIILLGEDNMLKEMSSKETQEFKKEGYENAEWLYWMEIFYEYARTKLAEGREI